MNRKLSGKYTDNCRDAGRWAPVFQLSAKFVLLILFCAFTSVVKAQSQALIGIKGGTNFSQLFYQVVGQRPPVQNYKLGYVGGVAFKYFANPHAGIQAEINYSQKGWSITQDGNIYEKSLDYLEIPVMSNLYLGNKRMQLFLHLGPYLAFLVNESNTQTINNPETTSYIFSGRTVSDFDYGVKVGVGLNYAFSFGTIQAEGRFSQGLNKLFDRFGSEQVQNQVLSISLAYFYEL